MTQVPTGERLNKIFSSDSYKTLSLARALLKETCVQSSDLLTKNKKFYEITIKINPNFTKIESYKL